jgi:hypothetical protein
MTETEYNKCFGFSVADKKSDRSSKALEHALDIRKFEIGLYWQRATYFWALITASFAGYFAILSSEHLNEKEYLAFIVACIGLVFTWAWFLVNRGSKYWQENWENHVDMLEDETIGPLYKTVLSRSKNNNCLCDKLVTGPAPMSASKINQWVSLFTAIIWLMLIWNTILFDFRLSISWKHVVIGIITLVFCCFIFFKGRTFGGAYDHVATKRNSRISED